MASTKPADAIIYLFDKNIHCFREDISGKIIMKYITKLFIIKLFINIVTNIYIFMHSYHYE